MRGLQQIDFPDLEDLYTEIAAITQTEHETVQSISAMPVSEYEAYRQVIAEKQEAMKKDYEKHGSGRN